MSGKLGPEKSFSFEYEGHEITPSMVMQMDPVGDPGDLLRPVRCTQVRRDSVGRLLVSRHVIGVDRVTGMLSRYDNEEYESWAVRPQLILND